LYQTIKSPVPAIRYRDWVYRRANEGIRTPDLLITNQLLYQLSYIGVWRCLGDNGEASYQKGCWV
jgi:hypothetical protein